jgi:hypothetical protein
LFWGAPGTGKSTIAAILANKLYPSSSEPNSNVYYKPASCNWFDQDPDQKVIIHDDFDGRGLAPSVIKTMFDNKPCTVEVKGGMRPLINNLTLLTTNRDPAKWLDNEKTGVVGAPADVVALKRRMFFFRVDNVIVRENEDGDVVLNEEGEALLSIVIKEINEHSFAVPSRYYGCVGYEYAAVFDGHYFVRNDGQIERLAGVRRSFAEAFPDPPVNFII